MANCRPNIANEQLRLVWNIILVFKTFLVTSDRNASLTIDSIKYEKSKMFTEPQGWKENIFLSSLSSPLSMLASFYQSILPQKFGEIIPGSSWIL